MNRKRLALLLAMGLCLTVFAGCSQRNTGESVLEEESQEESVVSEEAPPEGLDPDELAAWNNEKIDANDIHLVQFAGVNAGDPLAVVNTSLGTIKIKLFPEQAPQAVTTFVELVEKGYYNGMEFYNVMEGTAIYMGDPKAVSMQELLNPEPSLDLWHFRGALAMDAEGEMSNPNKLYIVQRDFVGEKTIENMRAIKFPDKVIDRYKEVGGMPNLDSHRTVFGMVTEGMDVVDAIAAVPVKEQGINHNPAETLLIDSIQIENA